MAPEAADKTATPAADPSVGERDAEVQGVLHDHGLWWWRILWRSRPWRFITPWPLRAVFNPLADKKQPEVRDSVWMTLALGICWMLLWDAVGADPDGHVHAQRASEWSRQLVTGAFLLGTLLSVSNALPGQTVLKALVRTKPESILSFAAPYVWAVTTGLLGATMLFFYSSLTVNLRKLAVFMGVYGGLMEIHTLAFTFRMFLLGLLRVGRDERKKRN